MVFSPAMHLTDFANIREKLGSTPKTGIIITSKAIGHGFVPLYTQPIFLMAQRKYVDILPIYLESMTPSNLVPANTGIILLREVLEGLPAKAGTTPVGNT